MAQTAREEILSQVRRALGRSRAVAEPVDRPQSGCADLSPALNAGAIELEKQSGIVEQFERELCKVGGRFVVAHSDIELCCYVSDLARARAARRAIAWKSDLIEKLGIVESLRRSSVEVIVDSGNAEFTRTAIEADLGVSEVDYALGDTGTLVLLTGPGRARSVSLVAPVHIAILKPEQMLAGLNDLFPRLRNGSEVPSAITLITGPSRTADIEMTLVVGVHGPQELHVILLDSNSGTDSSAM